MAFLCKLVGHKPEAGPLKRSPNTVYTHWRDVSCARCGALLGDQREYRDARTEPELFQDTAQFVPPQRYSYSNEQGYGLGHPSLGRPLRSQMDDER